MLYECLDLWAILTTDLRGIKPEFLKWYDQIDC